MRFSIAAVLAFAASALAVDPTDGFNVITKPTKGEEVPAGSTYEIVWSPDASHPGAITIGLLGGAKPNLLDVVGTIAKGVDASKGSYSWTVPSDATLATYGIMITLESNKDVIQYGFPFKITGGSSSSGSTSSTGSATTTGSTSATTTASGTGTDSVTSTTFTASSSTTVSSTVLSNSTTTGGSRQTTVTTVTTSKPSSTSTSTTSIVTNGVASLAAGSFAMLGGVAMAVLAL